MGDAVRKPWEAAVPVARANRRRASGSLDDAPHRPQLPSYPADRPRDLYGSLLRTFGINPMMRKYLRDQREATADLFKATGFRGDHMRLRKCFENRV